MIGLPLANVIAVAPERANVTAGSQVDVAKSYLSIRLPNNQ